MNWRLKCLGFKLFEALPFGGAAYRLAQRLVTGRYLPKISESRLKTYNIPVAVFSQIDNARVALEFGAGRALTTPLLLSAAGAERVYAVDLQRLAHIDQVNAAIGELARLTDGDWTPVDSFAQLKERYGIVYQAPGDARSTGLADGSVDFVYSTATLEHIPPNQIVAIMRECRRILRTSGRVCFTIDYHDHYASADRSIGYMNFYQFGEEEWRRYNPDSHFQNRLRHSDYVSLFRKEGWEILIQEPHFERWSESDLHRVALHPSFKHYSQEDLTASNGYFVLAPGKTHAGTAVPA